MSNGKITRRNSMSRTQRLADKIARRAHPHRRPDPPGGRPECGEEASPICPDCGCPMVAVECACGDPSCPMFGQWWFECPHLSEPGGPLPRPGPAGDPPSTAAA